MKSIPPEAIAEIESAQFAQLDPSCIAAMTSEQFDSLPNEAFDNQPQDGGIEAWEYAPETVSALSPDQMEAFAVEATQEFRPELLSQLPVETFESFNDDQLSSLISQAEQSLPAEFANLLPDPVELRNFDFDQFADEIPDDVLDQVQEQILPNLTPQMAELFDPSQLGGVADKVDLLRPDFINALNEDQLAAIGQK